LAELQSTKTREKYIKEFPPVVNQLGTFKMLIKSISTPFPATERFSLSFITIITPESFAASAKRREKEHINKNFFYHQRKSKLKEK